MGEMIEMVDLNRGPLTSQDETKLINWAVEGKDNNDFFNEVKNKISQEDKNQLLIMSVRNRWGGSTRNI